MILLFRGNMNSFQNLGIYKNDIFSLFEGQIRTGQINERELGPPGSAFYWARMRTSTHTESSSWAKIQARRIDGNKFGFLAWMIQPDKAKRSAAKASVPRPRPRFGTKLGFRLPQRIEEGGGSRSGGGDGGGGGHGGEGAAGSDTAQP